MTSPQRVLLVVGLVAGGAGRHVHELAIGLRARGVHVTVACPAQVEERYGFAEVGAEVIKVEIAARPHPVADARTMRALRSAVHAHDVIHAHGLRAGAMAALATRVVPVVVTLHNAPPNGPGRVIFHALERVVSSRATSVLAVSPDLVDRMRGLGARHVALAVIAAPTLGEPVRGRQEVRRELGDPGTLLLSVGRLSAQKDFDLLLDALARLRPRDDLLLAIAGDGPLRQHLQQRIDTQALPVRLLGHRTDVPDLLRASDLVISSAHWEGQPVWLQEALQAGRAIVATRVGGTAEVLGPTAVLVPPSDPDALAAAIEPMLTDRQKRKTLEDQALSRAQQLPDQNAATDAALAAYDEVLHDTQG